MFNLNIFKSVALPPRSEVTPYTLALLNENKEVGSLAKIRLALKSLVGKAEMGSAQHLANATKAYLSTPEQHEKLEAFYAALKGRVSKISGVDLSAQDTEALFSQQCIKQVLAIHNKKGLPVEKFSEVQTSTLQKIAEIEKDAFVQKMQNSYPDPEEVKAAVQAKSAQLATLEQEDPCAFQVHFVDEHFQESIKKDLFVALKGILTCTLGTTPSPRVIAHREKDEKVHLASLRAELVSLESKLESFSTITEKRFNAVYNEKKPKMVRALQQAGEDYQTAQGQLTINICDLKEAVVKLMEAGVKANANCSSLGSWLKELDDQAQRGEKALLVGKLNNLSNLLGSKEMIKLKEREAVQSAMTLLLKFIDGDFAKAESALTLAQQNLIQLETEMNSIKVEKKQHEEGITQKKEAIAQQGQLLVDQDKVNSYESVSRDYDQKMAQYKAQPFYAFWIKAPMPPVAPQTKTGGVKALVEKEDREEKAVAQALYDYLNPVTPVSP